MIVGHQRQIRYLERMLAKGTLAHAYLFYGPEAVGKRTAALELAKSLLCKINPWTLGGCGSPAQVLPAKSWAGQCRDCLEAGNLTHPDLLFLSRQRPLAAEELKREMGIKNIHELKRLLALAPWRGGRKVAIVDGAEAMSRDAQAALLKILEEPPPGTVFILITDSPDALYSTIRSRSVPLSFALVGNDDLLPLLKNIPSKEHHRFFDLAQGRPGLLIQLLQDKKFFEEFRLKHSQFRKVMGADLEEQFAFSEKGIREPGALESFLEFLIRHFYGEWQMAVREFSQKGKAPGQDRALKLGAFLGALLGKLSITQAVPVNRRLMADSVFFDLLEAKLNAKVAQN